MEVSARASAVSPERSMVWTEPKSRGRVPVVYYLSRNGQLEHPHFMEVALSSTGRLLLRDVVNRFDFLRGKGMASMYSWSSKRNYKNGFVWQDLSDDDLILPALGNEYILKGSELLHGNLSSLNLQDSSASQEILKSDTSMKPNRAKDTSWSSRSLDLGEYKVHKAVSTSVNADAATQTDEKRRRRRAQAMDEEIDQSLVPSQEINPRTELGREEISPPPSSPSPETLESLIKSDGTIISAAITNGDNGSANCHSGRFRASASAVVMHLISCGSFSLAPPYRSAIPRGACSDDQEGREMNGMMGISGSRIEEKEYFSGSIVEMKKSEVGDAIADFPVLKRSSSYNAERSAAAEEKEEAEEAFRAKCIPRRPKGARRPESSTKDNVARVSYGEHVH